MGFVKVSKKIEAALKHNLGCRTDREHLLEVLHATNSCTER